MLGPLVERLILGMGSEDTTVKVAAITALSSAAAAVEGKFAPFAQHVLPPLAAFLQVTEVSPSSVAVLSSMHQWLMLGAGLQSARFVCACSLLQHPVHKALRTHMLRFLSFLLPALASAFRTCLSRAHQACHLHVLLLAR